MSIHGRSRELNDLEAASGRALVTIWGPGGVGKTTLARAFVGREAERGAAVVWADLAPVTKRDDAIAVLARALGVDLDAKDDATTAIARAVAARRALLVADNVEQLDDDARRVLSAIAEEDGARVLITSRDARPGEHAIELAPLLADDALALFASRSGCAADDTARAIVSRLDAIPLAIELAAARAPLLGARELLERLDAKLDVLRVPEKGARHATLRAAIAWSWDLLDAREREALVACATFEAPFTARLAETVIGAADALDRLEALRVRALLHARDGELRLLESVRDFAREQEGYAALLERHDRAVGDACLPHVEDLLRGRAVARELAARHVDLEAASSRGAVSATFALVAHLSVTGPAWKIVERVDAVPQRHARLEIAAADALRAMGDAARAEARLAIACDDARTLADRDRVLGSVLRARGKLREALDVKQRALDAYIALGERALAGICLGEMGAIHQSEGRFAMAREKHADAIAIHVAEKSRRAEGVERSYLGVATHRAGDPAAAIPIHREALAIHREVGHTRLEGAELLHLAYVLHEIGDAASARDHFVAARATLARAGARGLESLAIALAARLEVDEGDWVRASLLLAESAHAAPAGWPRLAATRKIVEGHLALSRGDAGGAARAYSAALGESREVEVGFEALTPAYLARAKNETSAPSLPDLEDPHLRVAYEVLLGRSANAAAASARASSEVRRALRFAGQKPALRIGHEARTITLPDGRTLDLAKRKNVRLVLVALAEARRARPGIPVSPDALVGAGWPGERMRADAAQKRLHTAIWTLRSLGLEALLVTREDGYFLDPAVPIEIAQVG